MNTSKPDYVARKETKNVILRPQVSPKNPKSGSSSLLLQNRSLQPLCFVKFYLNINITLFN